MKNVKVEKELDYMRAERIFGNCLIFSVILMVWIGIMIAESWEMVDCLLLVWHCFSTLRG